MPRWKSCRKFWTTCVACSSTATRNLAHKHERANTLGGGFRWWLSYGVVRGATATLYAPRLALTFGTSNQFLTRTPELSPSSQSEALYVRVKVVNTRSALAKSCRAYLVNVERKGQSGKFELTEYCESLQLGWSSQAELTFSAFDLPRDVPHFADIMSTRPASEAFALSTKVTPLRYLQMLRTPGVYRFTIVVSGDGVMPATIRPAISWTGVCGTRSSRLIRRDSQFGVEDRGVPLHTRSISVMAMLRQQLTEALQALFLLWAYQPNLQI